MNSGTQNITPTLLVHGGAGDVSDESIAFKKDGVKLAARIGYETLRSTGNVVDAVQEAVKYLESDVNFNAGYGSVLTWEGNVEMDAAIMNGLDLNAGCVSLVKNIMHPISVARSVMDKTSHMYLAGEGLMDYARDDGFEVLPEGALITDKSKKALDDYKNRLNPALAQLDTKSLKDLSLKLNGATFEEEKIFGSPGTVGAVAIDAYGNVAAATSTGGMSGKMPGRIGDSPILGGGTYADNASGCVSATGSGETIMRYNVASRILALIKQFDLTAQQATVQVLEEMTQRFNQPAGVISIDPKGNLGVYFTSKRMSWAYQRADELHYGIDKGEDIVEIVGQPKSLRSFK